MSSKKFQFLDCWNDLAEFGSVSEVVHDLDVHGAYMFAGLYGSRVHCTVCRAVSCARWELVTVSCGLSFKCSLSLFWDGCVLNPACR